MTKESRETVTQMLLDWSSGDREALEKLTPLVYDELRRLARHYLRREREGHTLQSTALVHEVFLRLFDQEKVNWKDRAHFYGVCAKLMRRVLVDYARQRRYAKRQGEAHKVSLDQAAMVSAGRAAELMAVDDALVGLEGLDPRKSRIVELRFFGGLTIEETAQVLNASHATIEREWNAARAWLYHEITQAGINDE